MPSFLDRVKRRWNAFRNNRDPTTEFTVSQAPNYGIGEYFKPDRFHYNTANARSIVAAILNRIALDAAQVDIQHVRLDKQGRVIEIVDDDLNQCFSVSANLDQTGRQFRQDLFSSLLDEGSIAIVPVNTDFDPRFTDSYKIYDMRIGRIVNWYPDRVKIDLYNEETGKHEDVILPKKMVGIVENPFYAVMNEPNSTLKRLIRKMNILDAIDEQSGSGKLDLIIQLPYTVRTETKREQAEERRKDIEMQLTNSKYGIAYIDSTEHITQLNRAVDNNLMKQIEYLTEQLMGQLGITPEIMNGTAEQDAMTNYTSRTIEPIVSAPVAEIHRKFLSKTARSQGHAVQMFLNPFRLIPANTIAEISDKLTRNEILSSNEVRGLIGFRPIDDPIADQLRNANISAAKDQKFASTSGETGSSISVAGIESGETDQNGV